MYLLWWVWKPLLLCSKAGLRLAGSAFQTVGKALLKVVVSFMLLFKAGSVEAARSYLLPGVPVPLGARLTTPDRLPGGVVGELGGGGR